MAKVTFLDLAERVLLEENRPLSADEIWSAAANKGLDREVQSSGKTPWMSIGAQIYVDLKNPNSTFVKVGSRPRRFFLRKLQLPPDSSSSIANPEPLVRAKKKLSYLERELHSLLTYFAFTNLSAYCKTINHSRSDRKEYGEWV